MDPPTGDDLTPETLNEYFHSQAFLGEYGGRSLFVRLFTPETRAMVLSTLVGERGDALSARMIANHHEDLSISSVHRQKAALLDLGVIEERGKVGNAMTYAVNVDHPLAQLAAMIDNIGMWGETPQLLDETFISTADRPSAVGGPSE